MDALKNKYGHHGDPGFNQEISALVRQSKMSFFEFVGVNKIQKKLALVIIFLYLYFLICLN